MLTLPRLSPEILQRASKQDRVTDEGGQACFIALDDHSGLKLFRHRAERNHAHTWHTILAPMGLAPRVSDSFDLPFVQTGRSRNIPHPYGLIMERVVPATSLYSSILLDSEVKVLQAKRNKLQELAYAAGLWWNDCHYGNWGHRADGTPVILDMGWDDYPDVPMHLDGLS